MVGACFRNEDMGRLRIGVNVVALFHAVELVGAIDPSKAVVAGGVKQATIADYAALNPGIIVAGAALYGAPIIRKAVVDMKEALEAFEEEQD